VNAKGLATKEKRLTNPRLHSPSPYFLLVALLGLVPVLNNKYPAFFFPSLSPWWVEVVSSFTGIAAATVGFTRVWALVQKKAGAKAHIQVAIQARQITVDPSQNDVASAGRFISRLIRNADEDLKEIRPDFSMSSLDRLNRFLPVLLLEIGEEEDARVRLGVVGSYLGEVACRNRQWQWFFKADPALKQFSYLASVIRRGEMELDPFAWAADLLEGKSKTRDWLGAVQ
jgi:hypothetical protein